MSADSEIWPREPPNARDVKVIAAVHGASQALMRRLGRSASPHGLDGIEALVLWAILLHPGCAPVEIRRRLGVHRSTLSSVLDRLQRAGSITRRPVPWDGRRLSVQLTPAGRIVAEIAEIVINDLEAEIAGYTSPTERRGATSVYEACVAMDVNPPADWE